MAAICLLSSCRKWSDEKLDILGGKTEVAQPISDAAPLCGAIKGTMLAGKTYTINCDIRVNAGDTLIIQPGVRVNVKNRAGIFVQGSLLSLGTKSNPIWLTVDSLESLRNDGPNRDPATDPALNGGWAGLYCATSCPLLIIKWTHLNFGGSGLSIAQGALVNQSAGQAFNVLFQNPNGVFVMEDSWIYGGVDDPIRITYGKFSVMRCTFEDGGKTGGDGVNCKGGVVGDCAYNVFIGMSSNGPRISNKGQPVGAAQTNVNCYNNTFISCGWRTVQTGRGANINYDEGARGLIYNNMVVNCKFGIRVVSSPLADTAHIRYGNSYVYADSLNAANQIYPTIASVSGSIRVPQTTDIPDFTKFLPATYKLGDTYDGSWAVQKNNPLFYNFPLPVPNGVRISGISAVNNYSFRLQPGSPAVGKGYTGFAPLAVVPVDSKYGATEITPPGSDIGAYQINGTGNQHF